MPAAPLLFSLPITHAQTIAYVQGRGWAGTCQVRSVQGQQEVGSRVVVERDKAHVPPSLYTRYIRCSRCLLAWP